MTDTLLWPQPPMTVQTMSDFIQRLPFKYKQNIWKRHSQNGYIAEYDILQTLHSFAALCVKLMDRTAAAPCKNDIEPKLKPLNLIIIKHLSNNKNGMTKEEFNSKLHTWILEPKTFTNTIVKTNSPKMSILSPSKSYTPNLNNDLAIVVATPETSLKQSQSFNDENKTFETKYITNPPQIIALKKSKTFTNLTSSCDDLMLFSKKKKKKHLNGTFKKRYNKKRYNRKGKTNEFFCQISVGQTVKLTNNRIAFVRYKGKVKFGIGIWYGIEIYDSLLKTRHNGTVFGKKYFNCPRNKGLFVKREIILSIVKPENIKKVLKDLEKKQIKKQKQQIKKNKIKKKQSKDNICLLLRDKNNTQNNELKIRKDFKRFARLSSTANDPHVLTLINKAKSFEQEMDDVKEDIYDDNNYNNYNNFFFKEQKNIFEIIENNDDENEYKITIFCQLNKYILQYKHELNQGLFINKVNNNTKEGRALILEFGIQANKNWFITQINNQYIKNMNTDSIEQIMKNLNYKQGYNIVFKQY